MYNKNAMRTGLENTAFEKDETIIPTGRTKVKVTAIEPLDQIDMNDHKDVEIAKLINKINEIINYVNSKYN